LILVVDGGLVGDGEARGSDGGALDSGVEGINAASGVFDGDVTLTEGVAAAGSSHAIA